jgi:branched-chain amino acid aminotransferase
MNATTSIAVTTATQSKLGSFDFDNIVFGTNPTDHIFWATYKDGAWTDLRIEPYGNITMSPIALCLHYGQTVFEGFKAYRMADGTINIFRPYKHHTRLNMSLERMCMPAIPEALFMEAVYELVSLEKGWIPAREDGSLYLRPFVIATEPRLGVKVSDEYLFGIVCMPMANYYAANLKVKVETEFVRAASGGTGAAKCGGNYGASFYPAQKAKEQGYDQVLWTDGKHNEYIEESGTMNIMFIIDHVLVTPPLSDSILDGVTRDSLIALAQDAGIQVEQRKISYKELEAAFNAGIQIEAFGVGTAAVISPIEEIGIQGISYYPDVSDGAVLYQLKTKLQNIRRGVAPDTHGWNYIIDTQNS